MARQAQPNDFSVYAIHERSGGQGPPGISTETKVHGPIR